MRSASFGARALQISGLKSAVSATERVAERKHCNKRVLERERCNERVAERKRCTESL